jgi:ABC-2 type transport system permease protein
MDACLIVAAGTLWFGVPLPRDPVSLLGAILLFVVVALSMGILVASLVTTQQQAALTAQFVLVPNILLSGFMFPINSMPEAMQWVTTILPMRYFLEMVRAIMMKELGLIDLWDQILPLTVLGVITFWISWLRFRKVFG